MYLIGLVALWVMKAPRNQCAGYSRQHFWFCCIVLIICFWTVHHDSTLLQQCNARLTDCFSKTGAYITHRAVQPLSDITEVVYPLEPQKALCNFFPKTCKPTEQVKLMELAIQVNDSIIQNTRTLPVMCHKESECQHHVIQVQSPPTEKRTIPCIYAIWFLILQ